MTAKPSIFRGLFCNFDTKKIAMETAELKINLINRIKNLEEPRIIKELQRLLDFELDKDVFELNEEQKKRIVEAKYDEGLSEEQANQEIEKWLKNNLK
ncbi:MAG TPA: hypothetical protein VKY32_09090 [Flavobacterium sp.]|nr:hypothetical protein [Flavobacterium sp.]